MRAAIDYVSGAMQNAAVLVRMGEMARRSPDASIAQAGEKLISESYSVTPAFIAGPSSSFMSQSLPQIYVGVGRISGSKNPGGLTDDIPGSKTPAELTGLLLTAAYSKQAT